MEEVVQLEGAVGPEQGGSPGEGALDVRQRIVLRVDEGSRDHSQEEREQVHEREPERAEEAEDQLDGLVRLLRRKLGKPRDLADLAGAGSDGNELLAHFDSPAIQTAIIRRGFASGFATPVRAARSLLQ